MTDSARQVRQGGRPVFRQAGKEALLLAGSLLVSAVLGAAGLYFLYVPPRAEISGWRTASILAGTIPEEELNQLGFRGQPIHYAEGDFVVVLVGDSQVEARPACALHWMPERRLEAHLRALGVPHAKVFTIGSSGYGQDQQLLALRQYFSRFRADQVLLWETPENDIWNNMFPTHWPANGTPKPTFRLEEGRLVGPTEALEQPIPPPPFWRRFWRQPGRDDLWEQYLPPAYTPLATYDGPVNRTWEQRESKLVNENLGNEKGHRTIFLTPRSPRMEYGLALARALLGELERESLAHGARFTTMVTSRIDSEGLPVTNWEPEVYRFRGKYYRASRRQREENIRTMNAGLDNYEIPVTAEHPGVGPADGHLNEHAVDQVMRDVAVRLAAEVLHSGSGRPPASVH